MIHSDNQCITVECSSKRGSLVFILSTVYGANHEASRRMILWHQLVDIGNSANINGIPWIVLSDFNAVRNSEEKKGGRRLR